MYITLAIQTSSEYGVDFSDPTEFKSIDDFIANVDNEIEDEYIVEKIKSKQFTVETDEDENATLWINLR